MRNKRNISAAVSHFPHSPELPYLAVQKGPRPDEPDTKFAALVAPIT
jgi:hypothetical protein